MTTDTGRSRSLLFMCVLLVEDQDLVRGLLTEAMVDAGFKVIQASNAESVLELASVALAPNVLVSDVNLGIGMDGFALVAAARRWWPTIPVLMMSGMATNFAGRRRCINERFLLKPFSLDTFLQNVAELAGRPGTKLAEP